jgi:hypothetical protein
VLPHLGKYALWFHYDHSSSFHRCLSSVPHLYSNCVLNNHYTSIRLTVLLFFN